ncbi:hypothetical protein CBR_g24445 [Chara braunii]|uniref:Phospholipase A-2-activating protein n=1 Tax=Chara braunii TaxID=69332 RepID=A0A388JN19_CHABU|nr:hypothetical protein CBR_g24445 [Chara braunii]|eukprot:GBG59102.1 hypothetical protein CBR_g24445 [Chara braunii]
MDDSSFKLRCELRGHDEDVRGTCLCSDMRIASASRDKTVRLWSPVDGERGGYELGAVMVGHAGFVGPVAWMSPNEDLPNGGLVTGGMDARVIVWDCGTASLVQDLRGHELQVTGVAVQENGDVVSCSIDKTLRVWRKGVCKEVLQGHDGPVLCVCVLPTGEIISGSGDCTIKLWRSSSCVHTFRGHTDSVRGLAFLPGVGIVSGSHDGMVRLWSVTGQPLLHFVGHTALVFSVAVSTSGEIASGSEDGTARVWGGDGECKDKIEHPGCVWNIIYLPNGDLVTACADGVIRVWTRDLQRVASDEQIQAYELALQERRRAKTVGGRPVSDLPGPEELEQPGKKDGQTRIVREGGVGIAYTWSEKEYKWEKIGEVVDGPSDALEKRTLNGVRYDFVFDVDIGDGAPLRKLPYNRGQNPYDVADNWLMEQELPPAYREQVVEFIVTNTGERIEPVDLSVPDPFTGGGAYVPTQSQMQGSVAGSRAAIRTSVDPSINADPFTGGGSGSSVAAQNSHTSTATGQTSLKHVPKRGYLYFDSAQFDGIQKKLYEFNGILAGDSALAAHAMDSAEKERLQILIRTLQDTSRYHASTFAHADLVLLKKLLAWPPAYLFPVLDVLRMLALHSQGATMLAEETGKAKDFLLEGIVSVSTPPVVAANLLTGARMLTNCFRYASLRSWVEQHRSEVLDSLAICCASSNKNVRLAFSTLLLNFAVLLCEAKDENGQIQCLSASIELASADEDPENIFRTLVAIGTLHL